MEPTSCRLPTTVTPKRYGLTLTPDFETFTFKGVVVIDITVNEPTSRITLHAADLTFDAKDVGIHSLHDSAGESMNSARRYDSEEDQKRCANALGMDTASEVVFDTKAQTATIVFPWTISAGLAMLTIEYSGKLNDSMAGFYRSVYSDEDGTKHFLGTTQFEPTDARRALPCWDEPALKAEFTVSINAPEGMLAISNMPTAHAEVDLGKDQGHRFVFQPTPRMSTYLLAFVVGDLEHIEARTAGGTLVRVFTVPGKADQGWFALETACRTLELYNEYFGIPYPLPKLDMVAIPDFAAGAMENWGLVTYRENAILIDPENSSATSYQRVAEVVTHELAHMWFGNLVTMQWWTHLWLNEGFATWMSTYASATLFPDWDIWPQFFTDQVGSALSLDGLRTSHPIEVEVGHPDEIGQIFDAISYSKGAAIIHMLHEYIGAEKFRAGMQLYLKRFAYKNASTEDLWDALSEAYGGSLRNMMERWTKQAGYPVISFEQDGWTQIRITQERFLSSGAALTNAERGQQWLIPLPYIVSTDRIKPGVRTRVFGPGEINVIGSGTATHLNGGENDFLKLNAGQTAPIRVNYPAQQWRQLAKAVSDGRLGPIDRFGLVSDALALAYAGRLSTAHLLGLLTAYLKETDYTVWSHILDALGAVSALLEETPLGHPFDRYARSILAPIANSLGWDEKPDEQHTTKLLRSMILGSLGAYGDTHTNATATDKYWSASALTSPLNPNIRGVVYNLAARTNSWNTYSHMRRLYEDATLQEERVRLLGALGRFRPKSIIRDLLVYAFDTDRVRIGDITYVLDGLSSHPAGRRAAWSYLKNNWESIRTRYESGGLKMLGSIIETVCDGFVFFGDANDIEAFFAKHPTPSVSRSVEQTVEAIHICAEWQSRDFASIEEFLAHQ